VDASAGMTRPKPAELPQPAAEAEQIESKVKALAAKVEPKLKEVRGGAVVALLWSSGMRIGEASRLAWSDVDLDEGTVTVRISKTGKHRTTVIDRRALAWLARWRKVQPPSPLVFGVQKRCLQADVDASSACTCTRCGEGLPLTGCAGADRRSASRCWRDGGRARPWLRDTPARSRPKPRWWRRAGCAVRRDTLEPGSDQDVDEQGAASAPWSS
jgi:hypothetical protein